jgi:ArsR family transcriptional regulator, arsenate/arsenite/antimonite-responsive transcriptional repressor
MSTNAIRSLPVEPITQFFRALGDASRVRIVALLAHGELCVCHIQEALAMTQPNASRHLGVLKNSGLVESRRMGSWIYYRLAEQTDAQRRKQLQSLIRAFSDERTLRADVERLLKTRGPGACE